MRCLSLKQGQELVSGTMAAGRLALQPAADAGVQDVLCAPTSTCLETTCRKVAHRRLGSNYATY